MKYSGNRLPDLEIIVFAFVISNLFEMTYSGINLPCIVLCMYRMIFFIMLYITFILAKINFLCYGNIHCRV